MLREETIEEMFKVIEGAIKQFKVDYPDKVHYIYHLDEMVKVCKKMPCQEAQTKCLEEIRKKVNKYVRAMEIGSK